MDEVTQHPAGGRDDWGELQQRLAAARHQLGRAWEPTLEQVRALLKKRAELLARPPVPLRPTDGSLPVLEFVVAGERYGVGSLSVLAVRPLTDFTALPGAPPHWIGLTSARGRILPLLDLRRLFGLPDAGPTDLSRVVLIQDEDRECGILADSIGGIVSLAPEQLQSSLPTLTGIRQEYLCGVTGEGLVVLDPQRILRNVQLTKFASGNNRTSFPKGGTP